MPGLTPIRSGCSRRGHLSPPLGSCLQTVVLVLSACPCRSRSTASWEKCPRFARDDFYLDAIGTQPVLIVEAGWPSAQRFSTSEAMQAEFVRALFGAVAAQSDWVEFVSYYTVFGEDRQVATAWVTALG